MPLAMVRGHGRRQQDWAANVGDTLLGTIWALFTWSVVLGVPLRLALSVTGVGDGQDRARIATWAVLVAAIVLLTWGYAEARRVPRVRRLDVQHPYLGAGLDGTHVVLITDTHYGPLDRARWSARVCETVNTLKADLVCHRRHRGRHGRTPPRPGRPTRLADQGCVNHVFTRSTSMVC